MKLFNFWERKSSYVIVSAKKIVPMRSEHCELSRPDEPLIVESVLHSHDGDIGRSTSGIENEDVAARTGGDLVDVRHNCSCGLRKDTFCSSFYLLLTTTKG